MENAWDEDENNDVDGFPLAFVKIMNMMSDALLVKLSVFLLFYVR